MIGPPPFFAGSRRQAWAAGGIVHAVRLTPKLLLMRMVSGSPIAPESISVLAFITGG